MQGLKHFTKDLLKPASHINSLGHELIPQNFNFDSPEYKDMNYRKRRSEIAELSKFHCIDREIQ